MQHRRFALVAVAAFLLCIGAAVATEPEQEGHWRHATIQGLRNDSSHFAVDHTLYARPIRHNASWTDFVFMDNATDAAALGLVAVVKVNRNKNVEGWDHLKVRALVSDDGFFAAGWAEGYLTYYGIYTFWYNIVRKTQALVDRPDPKNPRWNETAFSDFIKEHIAYEKTHEPETDFGRQLKNQVRQLEGITAGWAAGFEAAGRPREIERELNYTSIFLANFQPEVDDIKAAVRYGPTPLVNASQARSRPDRCSVIVKLTPEDLYAGHSTWFDYNSMTRQFKTYEFPGLPRVRSSSYPGVIGSTDDYFLTDHQLAIMETTLENENKTLARTVHPNSVALFHRTSIAAYLATTPKEWVDIFSVNNSGTCSDQWMVIHMGWAQADLNASRPLRAGTFWVAEQTPGLVVSGDQTAHLQHVGYWASYNIPYYPSVRQRLNVSKGAENSVNFSPRGRIFARMQLLVDDITSLYYMLRFNNYKYDHSSTYPKCITPWNRAGTEECTYPQDPSATIAARNDLAHGVNMDAYGAIDAKVTSARLMILENFTTFAISGPTTVQQPPFEFTSSQGRLLDISWFNLPTIFDYNPVRFNDEETRFPVLADRSGRGVTALGIVVLVGACTALLCVAAFAALRARRAARAAAGAKDVDEGTPLAP